MKRHTGQHAAVATAGMTLVELLVSLGVLMLIGVAFGTILSQTQKVVEQSNALMRCNAAASAIAQVAREDLANLSPEGFLAVYVPTDPDEGHLVFTAVGPFTSKTRPGVAANAARIDYGIDPNAHNGPGEPDGLIWRRAILLSGVDRLTPADPNVPDTEPNMWLGRYDPGTPSYVEPNLNTVIGYCQPPTIPSNPSLGNVGGFWPLLARPCKYFRVSWWDGSTWQSTTKLWGPGDPLPPAIRVLFRLSTGPKAQDYLEYEVICPIRR